MVALTMRLSLLVVLLGPSWASGQPLAAAPNERHVEDILSTMTVREKIGQLFMVGFNRESLERDETLQTLLTDFGVGGVILYEHNIRRMRPYNYGSAEPPDHEVVARTVAELTNALQGAVPRLERDRTIRIPLLIAADQENGSVTRIEAGVTALPGALAIGQTRNAEYAYKAGEITGSELRALGINMNLAPVMDVNTNANDPDIINDRAFGGHQDIVAPLGTAFIRGLQDGGVVAVAKHFPGHGDSRDNPHSSLPVVQSPLPSIKGIDLPPFEAAIDVGVGAIMTAHMHYRALNSLTGLPFSMDPKLRVLLRDEMKFTGVVVSDDLVNMHAATGAGNRTLDDAVRLSFEAGTDLIVLAHFCSPARERADNCREGETTADEVGNIVDQMETQFGNDTRDLDESVRRILRLKSRIFPDFNSRTVDAANVADRVRTNANLDTAAEIAREAVVLLRENGEAVQSLEDTRYFSGENGPLTGVDTGERVLVASPVFTPPELLGSTIKTRYHVDTETIPLVYGWRNQHAERETAWPDAITGVDALKERLRDRAKGAAAIIFGVMDREHAELLEDMLNYTEDTPVFVFLGRQPNILPYPVLYDESVTTLSVGSNKPPSTSAIVSVLYGDVKPKTSQYVSVSVDPAVWIDIAEHPLVEVSNARYPDPDPGPNPIDRILAFIGSNGLLFLYLVCYLAGVVGACTAVVGGTRVPSGLWVDRKGVERQAGWLPILVTRAICGPVLYLMAHAGVGLWPGDIDLALNSYSAAMLFGFAGGTTGHAVVNAVPLCRPVALRP